MKLTYLLNSGFAAELGATLLVFDDYRDPAGAVKAALPAVREVYKGAAFHSRERNEREPQKSVRRR